MAEGVGVTSKRLFRRSWRPFGAGILLLVGLVLAVQALAPVLISSSIVRDGIERALSDWTGHDVRIEGPPKLSFWPEPEIEVSRIVVTKQTPSGIRVLARVSRMTADFRLLKAIGGSLEFRDFTFFDPEIFLLRDEEGRLDWAQEGRLTAAIRSAVEVDGRVVLDRSLDLALGDVTINNGRVEVKDAATGRVWSGRGITGDLDWPQLSEPASLHVTAVVNGQALQLSGSSDQPLLLLAGRSASLELSLNSDLLAAEFAGTADLAKGGFLSGPVKLSTPNAQAALAWAGVPISDLASDGRLSIEARLLTTERALRFDELHLTTEWMEATGIIDLLLPQDHPLRVTGTLAANRFDLAGLHAATRPKPEGDGKGSFLDRMELDLRISGQDVSLANLSLTQAAVSILRENGQSRFDLVDGTLGGGDMTGQVITSAGAGKLTTDVTVSVRNADLGEIFETLKLRGPVPQAQGSLELTLATTDDGWSGWRKGRGSFRMTTGPGTLADLEPETILTRARQGRYQPLTNPEGQDLEYQSLNLSAAFARGLAEIETGMIEGKGLRVKFSGALPLTDGGLALSATISRPEQHGEENVLFIGGSLSEPMVIALMPPAIPASSD